MARRRPTWAKRKSRKGSSQGQEEVQEGFRRRSLGGIGRPIFSSRPSALKFSGPVVRLCAMGCACGKRRKEESVEEEPPAAEPISPLSPAPSIGRSLLKGARLRALHGVDTHSREIQ